MALPSALNPVTLKISSSGRAPALPGTVTETRMSPTDRLKTRLKVSQLLFLSWLKFVGAILSNSQPQKWSPSLSPTCPPRYRIGSWEFGSAVLQGECAVLV